MWCKEIVRRLVCSGTMRPSCIRLLTLRLLSPAQHRHPPQAHTTPSSMHSIIHKNDSSVKRHAARHSFSGTYVNQLWARQFILGSLLQRYDPAVRRRQLGQAQGTSSPSSSRVPGNAGPSPALQLQRPSGQISISRVEAALLQCQRVLSAAWKLPVEPLDTASEERILRLLARYSCGDGLISDEALTELAVALRGIPEAPQHVEDPVEMLALLEAMGYVKHGDNIHRVAYAGELHYPPQAHVFVTELLQEERQREGGDAFDAIRRTRSGPGYAIDSATTSEVDDAIGIEVNPVTGETSFVVYVSDATVYCPFDSALEQITARRLTTTTYLPEGVFFMLPKPVVEAATLRDDRPCRTFNIVFKIDERTAAVKDYSVEVGWLKQLRRITYDQVQQIVDTAESTAALTSQSDDQGGGGGGGETHPPPSWMTPGDEEKLLTILRFARLRLQARLRQQRERHFEAVSLARPTHNSAAGSEDGNDCGDDPVDVSLPDPLIHVDGTTVTTVCDQVISTQDARLAVAELMIAANEVCSRVAQANGLSIPFRGTRALSNDHVAAKQYVEPHGVDTLLSLDTAHIFLAEAMQRSIRRLSAVTRAIYHHAPLHHVGLDTSHYTHSTSPLRRYADMLVHHQLKAWLWSQGSTQRGRSSRSAAPPQYIPEYSMATLCSMISTKQERASLLQDSSTRFWILRYIEDQVQQSIAASQREGSAVEKVTYVCLVGETRSIAAAPTYNRFASTNSEDMFRVLRLHPPTKGGTTGSVQSSLHTVPLDAHWSQPTCSATFVSDIYIPRLQLAHTILHNNAAVRVGAVVVCEVACVKPTQGILDLRIVKVLPGGDERHYRKMWMGGLVSQLDT